MTNSEQQYLNTKTGKFELRVKIELKVLKKKYYLYKNVINSAPKLKSRNYREHFKVFSNYSKIISSHLVLCVQKIFHFEVLFLL